MGYNAAYHDPKYRKLQSEKVKAAWKAGRFSSLSKPPEMIICAYCKKEFSVKSHETKRVYCTSSCAAKVTNSSRSVTAETRKKISGALRGRPSSYKGIRKIEYITIFCQNLSCNREIELPPYLARRKKYCSVICAIKVIGAQTTSPKASKGKSGIRPDIDQNITFYSTWEANIARVFNLIGVKWEYAPRVFNLGEHTYRPDFYLPEYNEYVEVKNFMGEYSLKRDSLFRRLYPDVKLTLILKEEYLKIKARYKNIIKDWEN